MKVILYIICILAVSASVTSAQYWERVGALSGADLVAGAVSPTGETFVFSEVIHRSTDKGQSWRRPIPGMWIPSFLSRPIELIWSNSGAMFVLVDQSLWKSTDNGNTWESAFAARMSNVDYHKDGFLIASVNADVVISTDDGKQWTTLSPPKQDQNIDALFTDRSGVVYCAVKEDLYRSTTGGGGWEHVTKLPAPLNSKRVCSPKPGVTIAAFSRLVYTSTDSGVTWLGVYEAESTIGSLLRVSPDTIFLCTVKNIIHRSTNSGQTWSVYSDRFNGDSLAILFGRGDDLYLILNDSLCKHNTRPGGGWERLHVPNGNPTQLVASKTGNIFATADNGLEMRRPPKLWRYDHQSWKQVSLSVGSIPTIGVDSADRLCAMIENTYRWSTDLGQTWTQSAENLQGYSFQLAHSSRTVLLVSESLALYRSTNDGLNFVNDHIGITAPFLSSIAATDSVVYAAGSQTYYRSTDQGKSWEEPIFPFIFGSGVVRAISCLGPNVVLGVVGTGAYFSSDYGMLWENHSEGLTSVIISLQLTPSGVVLAGTFDGVFEYSPLTKTWKNVNDGVLGGTILSLALGADGKVYATTMGDGVWRTTKTYGTWTSDVPVQGVSEQTVTLYPNPASTEVTIHSLPVESYRVTIHNVLGETLSIPTERMPIDVSSLPTGHYYLRISTRGYTKTLPLVVVR